MWAANAVVLGARPGQTVLLDGTSVAAHRSHAQSYPGELVLTWGYLPVPGATASVTVTLTVRTVGPLFEASLAWAATAADVALWGWQLQVGAMATTPASVVLRNEGFGQVAACVPTCASYSNNYPQATYQFLAVYGGGQPGLYVGSHDATGASKEFSAQFNGTLGTLAVSAVPPDAGRPAAGVTLTSFPLHLQLFAGDWWDAAQIYRPFALAQADWTRRGPLVNRSDVPAWLLNMTTWVNSHWQQNDVFNTTGGDPAVVLARVSAIQERFALPSELGLHWYEWDTLGYAPGSNYTNCTSEVTCGFGAAGWRGRPGLCLANTLQPWVAGGR
jgi:hypothetical protein